MSDRLVEMVRSTEPRKIAARLLSMPAKERQARIAEYLEQKGCQATTSGGIQAKLDGEFSEGNISWTIEASATDPTDGIVTIWATLLNGSSTNDPLLDCALIGNSLDSPGNEMAGVGSYFSQDPSALQSTVLLVAVITPINGDSETFTFPIPIP